MSAPTPAASPPLPLRHCYWVVPGLLLAGEHPDGSTRDKTKDRLKKLLAAGIECFVDLTKPTELQRYDTHLPFYVEYTRKAIKDHGLPGSREQMLEILEHVGNAMRAGRPVYVHCRAGIGRTGTVIGCLLVERGLAGEAALAELNRLWQQSRRSKSWPFIPETEAQANYVREWQPGFAAGGTGGFELNSLASAVAGVGSMSAGGSLAGSGGRAGTEGFGGGARTGAGDGAAGGRAGAAGGRSGPLTVADVQARAASQSTGAGQARAALNNLTSGKGRKGSKNSGAGYVAGAGLAAAATQARAAVERGDVPPPPGRVASERGGTGAPASPRTPAARDGTHAPTRASAPRGEASAPNRAPATRDEGPAPTRVSAPRGEAPASPRTPPARDETPASPRAAAPRSERASTEPPRTEALQIEPMSIAPSQVESLLIEPMSARFPPQSRRPAAPAAPEAAPQASTPDASASAGAPTGRAASGSQATALAPTQPSSLASPQPPGFAASQPAGLAATTGSAAVQSANADPVVEPDPLLDPATLEVARQLRERFVGALFGLAVGDAVAAATQFRRPGSFTPVGDMIGGGPFDLPRGGWSDDTAMALCLAESLLERDGFDPRDQVQRYGRWQQEGYLSATGQCVGITASTARSLAMAQWRRVVFPGSHDPEQLDPEPLSRVVSIALFYFASVETTLQQAADSSRTTCQAPAVLDACRRLGRAMNASLSGQPKERILAEGAPSTAAGAMAVSAMSAQTNNTAASALAAAFWAFGSTDNFRDAVLRAANVGGNSDVVASVCGQIAGAHYGLSAIPPSWRNGLMQKDLIEAYADRMLAHGLISLST